MSDSWQRQREPDAVPTPTAVAVSDYCRRARSPASPREVRLALSLLSDEDDFRLRALTDDEPRAWPLGPYAVVDILRGTSPQLASRRQEVGYYALVEQLASVRAERALAPAPVDTGLDRPAASAPAAAAGPPPTPPAATSMKERIAPRKRARDVLPTAEPLNLEDNLAALERFSAGRRKDAPVPRGRFTNVDATRSPADGLLAAGSVELLRGLLEQHHHRFAIHRTLARSYAGRGGSPLTLAAVEAAYAQHGLLEPLERRERELLLSAYADHRGATGRVAQALGMTPAEVARLRQQLEVEREVEELRERFRREALSPRSLTLRLDLLGRTRYLEDLGIERRFEKSLEGDLRQLFKQVAAQAHSYGDLIERAARHAGAPAELLSRGADKLGLSSDFKQQFSSSNNPSP